MKKFKIIFTAIFATSLLFLGQSVLANEFNFSVKAIIPENQINKSSYFDLLMKAGEKQSLTVELTNSTDKTVVVEEDIASATTNINGVVEYSPNAIKADPSLKYSLTDYAKAPKEISLAPKSVQRVTVDVTMPNAEFKGVMAGGITFKEKENKSKAKDSDEQSVSIVNKYAYVIALLIRQNQEIVTPDLKLNAVTPSQVNYRNVINANLQNPNAGYLNQLQISATVKNKNDTSITYTENKDSMQMAPNTNFDYPISLKGERMKAGNYQLTLTAYGQKNPNGKYVTKDSAGKEQKYDYKWTFVRDFTIDADTATALNKKDVTVKPDNSWMIWSAIGLILIILLLIILLILWKRRKKEEEKKNNKEKEV